MRQVFVGELGQRISAEEVDHPHPSYLYLYVYIWSGGGLGWSGTVLAFLSPLRLIGVPGAAYHLTRRK